ncbi:MAG: SulP family inorganic anion transporter [Candidatus Melainabacteria bacterium]|nr:SulP family inorganic anion transporter [Candidatus Melainabacteria bacterium]
MSESSHTILPADRLAGLKQNWKTDIVSGFILFLVALPLSLGIAMASGMPPMAGIIGAMVGGLLVSQISGSFVTINGPAAGLIIVLLSSVERLGGGSQGYHATLAAIVISGVLLFVMGLFKAGELGKFFPASVVHGMLASIGIVIMLKQFPVMLGVTPPSKEPIELFLEIPFTIAHANPEIAAIGVMSMLILIGLTFVKSGILRKIPAPIIVVLAACGLGCVFHITTEHSYVFAGQSFDINPLKCLVQVPTNMATAFTGPDFNAITMNGFWLSVLSITLIQGIETVLSCSAVDKLDPYKRHADLSRDLSAVGLGSAISGMIGGLPMIAEIVRSTANIANGAKTRWSNFFHGFFILIFVLLAATMINSIPLSSLAALLVFTGYRLASPKVFRDTHAIGWEQSLLFVTTIVVTLATDLLVGVAAGVAVKFLLHILRGVHISQLFKANAVLTEQGIDTVVLRINEAAVFSNYISLRKYLAKIPANKKVVLDLGNATFIDHTVMEHLHDFARDQENSGGSVEYRGLELHQSVTKHPTASRKHLAAL